MSADGEQGSVSVREELAVSVLVVGNFHIRKKNFIAINRNITHNGIFISHNFVMSFKFLHF